MTTRCAENINLLSLLDQTPGTPQANRPALAESETSSRALSFERESCLSRAIAFLAGVSDDANHVVAVCIEELPGRDGLRLLVAINKKKVTSGDGILCRIKEGLDVVFRLLARARAERHDALEDQVFDAVVAMSRSRINARIGESRGSGSKPKTALAKVLRQVVDAVRIHYRNSSPSSPAGTFISRATALIGLLDNLKTQAGGTAPLKAILIEIAGLLNAVDIPSLLRNISAKYLCPTSRDGIVRRLTKLDHYQKTSHTLLKSAKKLAVFNNVAVLPVSLGKEWFERTGKVSDICSLDSCFTQRTQEGNLDDVCQKLSISPSKARRKFFSNMATALETSKFHAEVQIIAYLELHPPAIKPRVIASNKDACYLCNLFIQIHGQFHIPKTHGKLYPGWRMPAIPAFQGVEARFNHALEERIGETIKQIMSSTKRKVMIHPNESTVFSFSSSVSSIESAESTPEAGSGSGGDEMASSGDEPKADVTMDVVEVEDLTPSSGSSQVNLPGEHGIAPEVVETGSAASGSASRAASIHETSAEPTGAPATVTIEVDEPGTPVNKDPIPGALGPGRDDAPAGRADDSAAGRSRDETSTGPSTHATHQVDQDTTTHQTHSVTYTQNQLLVGEQPSLSTRQSIAPEPGPQNESDQSLVTTSTHPGLDVKDHPLPRGQSPLLPQQPLGPGPVIQANSTPPLPTTNQPTRTSAPSQIKTIRLIRGQIYTHRLDFPSPHIFRYTTGQVTVYPELTHLSTGRNTGTGPIEMRIHWLAHPPSLSPDEQGRVVPVPSIPEDSDMDSGSAERVWLVNGGDVVQVEVVRSLRR
ncbi:hypothetical protein QBC47DRAFT_202662 [Echria macrotheca]|uniref:Uncharacterized protein n=1 Tax=Echria macrotheca TaxID=438768 RepID=A0AAJ0BFF9_9PEZI|nr:hypothetical protein QBC47DRAFT_202662 [Echria macrotheca]